MIISNRNRFIFVHIPKTGGTSIKTALKPFYSENGLEKIPKMMNVKGGSVWKHDTASKIRSLVGRAIWNRYFTFAFVRNPWDWLVSAYYFIKKDKKDKRHKKALLLDFGNFLEWLLDQSKKEFPLLQGQYSYVYHKDKKLVNYIGKFEGFQRHFNNVCKKLNLGNIRLPKTNRTKHRDYKTYYNNETRNLVSSYFKKDIQIFKYEF